MASVATRFCGIVLCLTVISVVAQDTGCGSLQNHYVLSNLGNLSSGLSNIQQLRNLALRPLLKQPRVPGTAGSRLARTHIKTWMTAQGWTVEEDSFWDLTPFGYRSFSNIIATLNPGRPRRMILACHYDTKMVPGIRFVGAIDSAVPCSLLMDSAFRLKNIFQATKNTNSSDLTLQFVFFDGEESFSRWSDQDSLYGSRHLANLWATPPGPGQPSSQYTNQGIATLILLDLIGTSDTYFKLRYWETASVYNKLYAIESCLRGNGYLTASAYQRRLFTSQQDFTSIEDDHIPFLHRGVPVVHLITSPFPWVWHTAYDDLPYLDFDRIDNLARILRIFLLDLPL